MAASPILKALLEAQESERKACLFYTEAASTTTNPMGKRLFQQLEEHERYHLRKLSDLEESLNQKNAFIKYERREIPSTPRMVFPKELSAEQLNVIETIKTAVEHETASEKLYLLLADEITDPDGHFMFSRLSEEEHLHFHILKETCWNLNTYGAWEWTTH